MVPSQIFKVQCTDPMPHTTQVALMHSLVKEVMHVSLLFFLFGKLKNFW